MIVNHTLLKLGEDNLKRPEIWQSALAPLNSTGEMAKISLNISEAQNLKVIAKDGFPEPEETMLAIGINQYQRLIDPVHTNYADESIKYNLSIGNHKIQDIVNTGYGPDNEGPRYTLGIVNKQKLTIWGVRAESLDDATLQYTLSIDNHRLYEDK